MIRVGLTGGIACGKSRVVRRLAAAGLHTLDLDEVAREVIAPGGAAHREVVEAFGPAVVGKDGAVDRKALAAVVFADPAARARLNAITHPRIRAEEERRLSARGRPADAVSVTDAALLVESGIHLRFDRLVVVHCEPEQQLRRLMARDGIDERAAEARLAAQMPVREKRRYAHLAVDATGTLEETDGAADALAAELVRLARVPRRPAQALLARRLGGLVEGPTAGPRGLRPYALLGDIAAAGGLEMERAARLLMPPASGPWYRAALSEPPETGPETLAAPIVLWTLARALDDELIAAAAFSLARLTHVDDEEVAGAVLFALALGGAVAGEPLGPTLLARVASWTRLATRWAAAAPPSRITAAVEAAARGEAVDGELARALRGAARGVAPESAPAEVVGAVQALEGRRGV